MIRDKYGQATEVTREEAIKIAEAALEQSCVDMCGDGVAALEKLIEIAKREQRRRP